MRNFDLVVSALKFLIKFQSASVMGSAVAEHTGCLQNILDRSLIVTLLGLVIV